ncbi:MAG: TRAP transporter large permease subunit [Chitinophagaceae bacterium]|nr:TRAP transporter large permease subunit [Chitinophagaceae bacterium]
MTLLIIFICIIFLILLITWGKVNAFIAFLVVSLAAGLALGIPLNEVSLSVQKGIGDTLGSLVIIICLGAMLGKLVAEIGAAEKITSVLANVFGKKYINWALMVTGFVVGIPLFYNVGFVLLVPLIFSVVYQYKLPAVYIGLPMLAALSVTHGFLPPHPSPAALIQQFDANMGITLLYGLVIAIPTIVVAGPLFATTLKNIQARPLETFKPKDVENSKLPGAANSFLTSLFPVLLLVLTTILSFTVSADSPAYKYILFFGDPVIVMLISLIGATYTLGIFTGKSMKTVMKIYADSVADIAVILLIISGAGALKQVFADSGVSSQIGHMLMDLNIPPLLLGWLIAAVIRVCLGSATIAGLTTAGIIAPLMVQSNVNPNLMVLSIGAGSLLFSHVNDSGFWLFKEYFNLSIKDTIRSWSLMETIVGVMGLIGVMILNAVIS